MHIIFDVPRNLQFPAVITVDPIPQSNLSVVSTSNSETQGLNVTNGEYVTIQLGLKLPKGTILSPSFVVKVPYSNGLVTLVSGTLGTLPSNMARAGYLFRMLDTNDDGIKDTAIMNFTSVVNQPSRADGNSLIFTFMAFVPVSPLNLGGVKLPIASQLTYNNGTGLVSEALQFVNLTVVQPVLTWNVTWNATAGDAGDVLKCTVLIKHEIGSSATAENIDVFAYLAPYYTLLPATVTSTDSNATLNIPWGDSSINGIARLPYLPVGKTVTYTFSAFLTTDVMSSSTISNQLSLNYTSQLSGGRNTYLIISRTISIIYIFIYYF